MHHLRQAIVVRFTALAGRNTCARMPGSAGG